ncbi:WD40 repeat domain-containing protein [Thermotoga sp. KOL6]|uniref:WD40 repeat domain-containing protein n=1 Tax=Thermotoga sp. KOL6 TaxID=126741 RepID=UPI000C789781|nr:WD40 repeat domain-containing protein [Thermotoga sp. KOL6]PLV60441.1 hypothetical protein AS005_03985 [Thermotoga sp. KOL6]
MKRSMSIIFILLAAIVLFPQQFQLEKILGFSDVSALSFENGYLIFGTGSGEIVIFKDGTYFKAFKIHGGRVNDVEFKDKFVVSASDDGTIGLTNIETGEIKFLKGHKKGVSSVAISGDRIFSASLDGTVRIWSLSDGKEIALQRFGPPVVRIATFGNKYVVGLANGLAVIKDLSNASFAVPLRAHPEGMKEIVFSNDGRFVATCGGNSVKVWNPQNGKLILQKDYVITINDIDFIDERRLVFVTDDYKAIILDVEKNEIVKSVNAHNNFALLVSSDNGVIVTYGMDGVVKVWNSEFELQYSLFGHKLAVNAIAVSSDRKTILSGGDDREIIVWDMDRGVPKRKIKALSSVRKIMVLEEEILACLDSNAVKVYNMNTGKLVKRVKVGTTSTMDVAVYDGKLAVGFYDGSVALFSYPSFEEIWRIDTGHEIVQTIDVNDRFLAYGVSYSDPKGKIGYVEVFDVETGEKLTTFKAHNGNVNVLQMVGDLLLTGGEDGKIVLWNLENKSKMREVSLKEPISSIYVHENLAFIGTWNGNLHVFDFPNLTPVVTSKVSDQKIGQLCIVEGELFVPCGDGKIRIFRIKE